MRAVLPRRGRALAWGAALLVPFGALLATAGCASLDKPDLQERLAALPGNGPLADALRQATVELDRDGERLQVPVTYARFPRAGAPRVVLVHGTPGTLYNWSDLIAGDGGFAGLAEDFDVTAVELAGHGISPDGLEPRTFQECADVLGATLGHLDLGPAIVVSQSYGAEVAWRMALDRPELVSTLVLSDASGYPRLDDEWLSEEVAMRNWPGAGFGWLLNARDRIGAALEPHFAGPPPVTFHDELFLVCENASNWRTMVGLCRDENGERSPELATLAVPTLLVWGGNDIAYTVERFARQFERDIPDVELVVMPGIGHYPPQEAPADFARILRERFGR
jgi:pimeloyl-ACP methyl ester carboxylesterase